MDQYAHIVAFAEHLGPRTQSLPELPEVEQLTSRVLRVLGGNPGHMQLQGTNTYLVGTGTERLLIDSGQGRPRWTELITLLMREQGFKIGKVLLTHWHLDHTEGVHDLLRVDPSLKGSVYKYDPDSTQEPLADGQVFAVEGATVQAVSTPGHSTDHMCFFLHEEMALFTGDTVLGHGTAAMEDLETFMQSLRKVEELECRVGYPGHGNVIRNLEQKVQQEIGSRQRREQQIMLALDGMRLDGDKGSATQTELIQSVFGQLPADVSDRFIAPYMKAMLMKLAREKRVGFRLQDGRKRWFSKIQ